MSTSKPQSGNGKTPRHRRWLVHSHDAARPSHVDAKSDINITPLIDVMLVLLIIFMVVTPLAQRGLDIALPHPPPPGMERQKETNQVVLGIEDSGTISVNKTPVATLDELDQRLKDIYQTKSDKTIFVKAGGKVLYGKVVEAMDVARGAGVERIGIISEQAVAPEAQAGATGR